VTLRARMFASQLARRSQNRCPDKDCRDGQADGTRELKAAHKVSIPPPLIRYFE
jgi:hypothetical protein